jgi:hypothetical protein
MRSAILGFATLIALSQTAIAGVPSCVVVRFYVAKYSEAAAVTWARNHGASETDIETARRCLHGATVQTASARSQVPAPVPAQEPAKHEAAEHDSDQVAPQLVHVVSVQGQRADSERVKVDSEPDAHGFIRLKEVNTSRPSYVGAMHRAYRVRVADHVLWLKRLWANLTGRRPFRFAVLQFRGGEKFR